MTDKEYTLETMRNYGKARAETVQGEAADMTGTTLNEQDGYIPDFDSAKTSMNMLKRKIGFVCKTSAGRIVRLLQNYDSDVFTAQPEELTAQWGFAWSTNPAKAKPFIAISTSPYMTGDCCTFEGKTYRSKIDNNVHSPEEYAEGWEEVTT